EAVVTHVELAADEPFRERLVPLQHLVPLLEPVQRLRLLGPKLLGMVLRPLPDLLVLGHALDVRRGGELGGRRKRSRFLQNGGDGRSGRGHWDKSPREAARKSCIFGDCKGRRCGLPASWRAGIVAKPRRWVRQRSVRGPFANRCLDSNSTRAMQN